MIRRARELSRLIDEVADADWRHPAWWGLTVGTALLEASARERVAPAELYATFLAANGSPRADTFMARPHAPSGSAPERIARAVLRARAAASAVIARATEFPDQPLRVAVAWDRGWLRRIALPPGPLRVAFVLSGSAHLASLDPDGRDDERLAEALGTIFAGRTALTRIDPGDRAHVPAAICVSLDEQPPLTARHLHRTSWSRAGGPWLGLGQTSTLELCTTCHLAVDGYAHARVASDVFAALDAARDRIAPLAAAAARGLAGAEPRPSVAAPVAGAEPLGFAGTLLTGLAAPFAHLAYAFGRALEASFRAALPPAARRAARHSPTFQIPIALGPRDDPERLRRRFVIGLTSIRMRDGEFEPLSSFRERLSSQIAREARAQGLLSRILGATAAAPVPSRLRRRLLGSSKAPSPLLPPVEVLGGRGQLSSLRFLDGDEPPAPLYACSTPSLPASPGDARGSLVLTLIHHDAEAITASVAGTGLAATPDGARLLLDSWLDELARVR